MYVRTSVQRDRERREFREKLIDTSVDSCFAGRSEEGEIDRTIKSGTSGHKERETGTGDNNKLEQRIERPRECSWPAARFARFLTRV